MKTMKILSIIAILFGFSQCGSTKFEKNPPFKIESATYTNWIGGVPGVSGTRVELKLATKNTIAFDSIYFQKKVTKIKIRETKGITFLTGSFNTSTRKNNTLVLHADAKMELKNKVPKIEVFPFDLTENQAIISYKVGTLTKYFKLENIQKAKEVFFPQKPLIN
jgi:hypothetical protein